METDRERFVCMLHRLVLGSSQRIGEEGCFEMFGAYAVRIRNIHSDDLTCVFCISLKICM